MTSSVSGPNQVLEKMFESEGEDELELCDEKQEDEGHQESEEDEMEFMQSQMTDSSEGPYNPTSSSEHDFEEEEEILDDGSILQGLR